MSCYGQRERPLPHASLIKLLFLAFFWANCKITRRRGTETERGVRQGIRKVVDETGRIKTVRGTIAGILTTQGLG